MDVICFDIVLHLLDALSCVFPLVFLTVVSLCIISVVFKFTDSFLICVQAVLEAAKEIFLL